MKKIYLLLTVLMSSICLAQTSNWAPSVLPSATTPCPFDSGTSYYSSPNWLVYQTINDQWDGVIDSTQCIPFLKHPTNLAGKIPGNSYDPNKRLFIKPLLAGTNVQLYSNELYTASFFATNVNTNDSCGGDLCNSLRYGIEIPDSNGAPGPMRWHVSKVDSFFGGLGMGCLPTEKFSHNRIAELVITVKPTKSGDTTVVYIPFLEMRFLTNKLDSSSINVFRQGNDFNLYQNNLLLYTDSTYPDAAHISYVNLYPATPSTTVDSLNVNVPQYASFTNQPFAQLRGGKVLSGTARHHVSLNITGGNVCMPGFVELVIQPRNSLNFYNGDIRFGNERTCIMILPEAELVIQKNGYFHCGLNGDGMLALQIGSHVTLKENSTWLFDGHLIVGTKQIENDSVLVSVDKGETIQFTKKAKVSGINGSKLVILDNGGTIDLNLLDENSRKNIKVIRAPIGDKPSIVMGMNPFNKNLNFQITTPNAAGFLITLYDMNGSQVFQETEQIARGTSTIHYSTDHLSQGVYVLKVIGNGWSESQKLLKTD